MPATVSNSLALRCWVLPGAMVPTLSLRGLARAKSSSAFRWAKREFAVFKDSVEVKAAKDGRTQRYGTMEEAQAAAKRLDGEARDLGHGENTPAWVSLMLKRMIGWAVENGFDKIAWATGAQSAEHYKLEKHVSKLEWMENEKKLFGYDPKTEMMTVSEAEVTREKLPKYIGKELAERLVGQRPATGPGS